VKHILILFLALSGAAALADNPSPVPTDEVAQNLFAPELVLKYREEIALDASQSKALKEMIQKAQAKFLDLQWDMQAETGKLSQLLKARPVDSTAALAQVDRVLNLEHDVKRAQLGLLIGIKNLLSSAQQDQLIELRRKNP
jgi:Spy/CpxP family protein refolding chaperone